MVKNTTTKITLKNKKQNTVEINKREEYLKKSLSLAIKSIPDELFTATKEEFTTFDGKFNIGITIRENKYPEDRYPELRRKILTILKTNKCEELIEMFKKINLGLVNDLIDEIQIALEMEIESSDSGLAHINRANMMSWSITDSFNEKQIKGVLKHFI